jgi:hypothetical protein
MQEKDRHSKTNILRSKYHKEDLLSKSQFQEYKFDEFENIHIIRSHFFFCLYEATHKSKDVILLKMRYYNKNLLKNSMNTANVFKVKSKYLLHRYGFIINHFTGEFYTVYERPVGTIFDFDVFSLTEDNTLFKLYMFNLMAQLLDRLKRNLKDNFKIGLIQPDLFFFNINDEVPLKMIDFFFYFFQHLANSDKSLDFLRPALGMYELDRILPDDISNMKIVLTKLFTLEHDLDLNYLKNLYYMDLNSKVIMYKAVSSREINRLGSMQPNLLFDSQVKRIKNEKIKEFVLTFDQENIPMRYGNDVKYDYNDFYDKAFCPLYKSIINEYKCFTNNCDNQAEVIFPYCFEALCKNCKKHHKCDVLKFNELYRIFEKIPILEEEIETLKELHLSVPKTYSVDFTDEFYEKHYIVFNSVRYTFRTFKKTIKSKQEYFDFILLHLQGKFKEIFDKKIAEVEEILPNLNYDDEIEVTDFNNKLEDIEQLVQETKTRFENFYRDLSINESLYEILTLTLEYDTQLNSYYNNFIRFCVNDSHSQIIEELRKLKYTDEPMMKEIIIKEKQTDFYVPICETDLMSRIYDIKIVNNITKSRSDDIRLNFDSNIDLKLIPFDSKYCRINNMIIVTGGCIDNKTTCELDYTYIIDIKSNNVKKSSSMNHARRSHSIINQNDLFAIVVGGKNNNTCEKFSYLIEKWEELPSMNIKRANPSLFLLNNNYLYCFGGENDGMPIQTYDFIERLELFSEKYLWKFVNFSIYDDDVTISGINYGIFKKNENILLILGGLEYDERDNDYSESEIVYEYNIQQNLIRTLDFTIDKGWYVEHNFLDIGIKDYKFQVAFDKEGIPNLVKFKI